MVSMLNIPQVHLESFFYKNNLITYLDGIKKYFTSRNAVCLFDLPLGQCSVIVLSVGLGEGGGADPRPVAGQPQQLAVVGVARGGGGVSPVARQRHRAADALVDRLSAEPRQSGQFPLPDDLATTNPGSVR